MSCVRFLLFFLLSCSLEGAVGPSAKLIRSAPVGLRNIGLNCFMNAILQALMPTVWTGCIMGFQQNKNRDSMPDLLKAYSAFLDSYKTAGGSSDAGALQKAFEQEGITTFGGQGGMGDPHEMITKFLEVLDDQSRDLKVGVVSLEGQVFALENAIEEARIKGESHLVAERTRRKQRDEKRLEEKRKEIQRLEQNREEYTKDTDKRTMIRTNFYKPLRREIAFAHGTKFFCEGFPYMKLPRKGDREPFLILGVQSNGQSLQALLKEHFKQERFDKMTSCFDEKTKIQYEGVRATVMTQLPPLLLIYCSIAVQGEQEARLGYSSVRVPLFLDMSSWYAPPSGVEAQKETGYRLVGAVGFRSNHYIAAARYGEKWYLCNDETITEISAGLVEQKFKRAGQLPGSDAVPLLVFYEQLDAYSSAQLTTRRALRRFNQDLQLLAAIAKR